MPTTNNTVCVGQQINLTNNIMAGIPVTSYKWTLPGVTFKSYAPTYINSLYVTNAPADLTNNYVNFYWSDRRTNRVVTCTQTVYGQTNILVSAMLNISRPIAALMATNQVPIQVSTNYVYGYDPVTGNPLSGFPYLCYGLNLPTSHGIQFSKTLTEPSGFTNGTIEWVQLINSDYITNMTVAGPQPHASSGGVDTAYPYLATNSTGAYDDPANYLQTNFVQVSRNFDATMYLMWQASTNTTGGDNTVPVPLRSYRWNWGGSATNISPTTNNGSGWFLQSSSYPTSTATNVDATNEPTWTVNVTNSYVPPL